MVCPYLELGDVAFNPTSSPLILWFWINSSLDWTNTAVTFRSKFLIIPKKISVSVFPDLSSRYPKAPLWKTSMLGKISLNLTGAPWNLELPNMAVLREKHILSWKVSRPIHPFFSGCFCFCFALFCFVFTPSGVNLESNPLGRKQTWPSGQGDVLLDRGVLSPLRWPVLCMKWSQQAPPSPACTRRCSLFSWSWSAAPWARKCPLPPGATGGGSCSRENGSRPQTPAGTWPGRRALPSCPDPRR